MAPLFVHPKKKKGRQVEAANTIVKTRRVRLTERRHMENGGTPHHVPCKLPNNQQKKKWIIKNLQLKVQTTRLGIRGRGS